MELPYRTTHYRIRRQVCEYTCCPECCPDLDARAPPMASGALVPMAKSLAPPPPPSIIPPSKPPSVAPSQAPSKAPSVAPTRAPSHAPTKAPSVAPPPSKAPTKAPSVAPSKAPSKAPTAAPAPPPASEAPTAVTSKSAEADDLSAAMSHLISRLSTSNEAQLATTALVSGAVVAGAILGYQHMQRQEKLADLKNSIPELSSSHLPSKVRKALAKELAKLSEFGFASSTHSAAAAADRSKEDEHAARLAARAQKGDFDKELILEQLARNRVFLGDDGLDKLRAARVIVVGCGGVGSHCVAALARSGVSHLRLIDFDQVTLSSLNRHAVATLADVGIPKVQCLRRRLQQITPWVQFDCRNQLFNADVADALLADFDGAKPDYIVDAIDNIESKVQLLKYCHDHQLPVISSMGAGCKSDPTRVVVGDISLSTEDPLSRSTRRRLRAMGVATGVTVVFSTEKTGPGKAQLLPLPEDEFQKGKVGDLGVLPDFRVRILPVLGTMPAVFGYTAANHVILQLTGYPSTYIMTKERNKMYDGILALLQGAEEKLARFTTPGEDAQGLKVALNVADVGYVVEEVYKGRSVLSGLTTRLCLVRWRAPAGSTIDCHVPKQKASTVRLRDLVLMTKEEAAVHDAEVLRAGQRPEDVYPADVVSYVERCINEEREYEKYR